MFSVKRFSFSYSLYLFLAILGAILALSTDLIPGFGLPTSVTRQAIGIKKLFTSAHVDHQYQIQIFSRDPLIIYIRDFLSSEEIAHLLRERYLFQP